MEAAVVSYAEGVLKSAVGKLGTFLWNEALLIGSVRQNIQFIRDELQSMDGFLQDLVNSKNPNNQLKVWMLHVLELACDAELCIEDFTKVIDGRYGRGKRAAIRRGLHFLWTLWARYWTVKTIQELKSRAKEVSERRSRYNFTNQAQEPASPASEKDKQQASTASQEAVSTTSGEDKQQASTASQEAVPQPPHLIRYNHIIEEESLVDINMAIMENLKPMSMQTRATPAGGNEDLDSETRPKYTALAIVGPFGSGKTARAKMLYRRRNDPQHNISGAAWVTLSPIVDIKMVLKNILRQITKSPLREIHDDDEEKLKKELKEELQKQSRFLIILDSLWNIDDWNKIKPALPDRYTDHGIVVVTTHSEEVASLWSSECIHRVEILSEDYSDELVKKLFFNHFSSEFHLQELRPALKYCYTLPLALKCLCGMLAGADGDVRMANQVAIDVVDIMMQSLKDDEKLTQIIKLCYNYMPSLLKKCFADLTILPEGYAIKRKRLIRRWIAKGFVSSTGGLSEEEIAEVYFEELISRCVIKPETVQYSSRRTKSCTINGVFRDISSSGATSLKNENRPQESDPDPDSLEIFEIQSPFTVHKIVSEKLSSKNYTSLTILDLEGCKGLSNHDLNNLPKFIQLKFLSLRNTDVNQLPKKIGGLKHLQTLDIRQTKIDTVPHKIVNLSNLKHFLAGHSHKPEIETAGEDLNLWAKAVDAPEGIDEMRALQTLADINATKASKLLHVVRDLKNLKKLGLVIEEKELNTKPLCISIMMLSGSLRSLSVCDERVGGSLEFLLYLCFPPLLLKSLNLKGRLGKLPQWIAEHKNLSKLTLSETQLTASSINLLGKINSLACLKLYNNSLNEHVLTLSEGEFMHLQVFVVYCSVIQKIFFQKGTMPELKVFKWVFSKHQMGKVEGIKDLPMLKEVSLIGQVSEIISHDINYAIKGDENQRSKPEDIKNLPILQKIEQPIREHNYTRRTEKKGFTEKIKALFKKT